MINLKPEEWRLITWLVGIDFKSPGGEFVAELAEERTSLICHPLVTEPKVIPQVFDAMPSYV